MRYISVSIVLIGLLVIGRSLTPPHAANDAQNMSVELAQVQISGTPAVNIVADLLTRTNALRASLGLPPLALNTHLNAAAQNQAEWMVSSGLVVHQRPDGSLPGQRALAAGYSNGWSVSEIIYMGGIATVNDAWNFWLTSKVHYAELTRTTQQEVGIGVASSKAFGQAFVMEFGRADTATAIPVTAGPGTYIVQHGDTLFLIAQRHGVTLEALVAANHIGVNDIIYVGQVLTIPQPMPQAIPPTVPTIIPTTEPTTAPAPTVTPSLPTDTPIPPPDRTAILHVVQRGETLNMIAKQYNVSVDSLIVANGLTNPDRLEVGQVLIIP